MLPERKRLVRVRISLEALSQIIGIDGKIIRVVQKSDSDILDETVSLYIESPKARQRIEGMEVYVGRLQDVLTESTEHEYLARLIRVKEELFPDETF